VGLRGLANLHVGLDNPTFGFSFVDLHHYLLDGGLEPSGVSFIVDKPDLLR
jgi:hypothetical protein